MPGMNYWSLHFEDYSEGPTKPPEIKKRLIQADSPETARKLADDYVGSQSRGRAKPCQITYLAPYSA